MERLLEMEGRVGRGVYIPAKEVPLFSEVAQDWLAQKRHNLRETTWEVYGGHLRKHFEEFNAPRIDRITTPRIERFIAARHAQGMNVGTLRKALITLGQVMNYAVRHRYIDRNPVREAERPRKQRSDEAGKSIKILSPDQVKEFLAGVVDQRYRTIFLVAVMTGALQGEILGFKWSDLDAENLQIHIQRTFNGGRFFDTEAETSNRRVDIGPALLTELKRWKLACPRSDLGPMFPSETGGPINYSNLVQRFFLPALQAAGLPRTRFHDLRHLNAALRPDQGENIKYIQKQLGHSNPTVTLNVYAHLLKATNPEAACRLESIVLGSTEKIPVARW